MKNKKYPYHDTAEVLVGTQKTKFTIHIDAVCERSTFFRSALSLAWRNDAKPIDLTDTEPSVFSDYLQVLCQGKPRLTNDLEEKFSILIRLYCLADRLGDLRSANTVIDTIIEVSDRESEIPSPRLIKSAFKKTPENSPLRRLMVDYYVHERVTQEFDQDDGSLPKSFLVTVVKEFTKFREMNKSVINASERPPCYYHQHDDFCAEYEDSDYIEEEDANYSEEEDVVSSEDED